jgi:hypothetical protein
MREHAVPEWPDPDDRGGFPVPARFQGASKSVVVAQTRPCEQHLPSTGFHFVVNGGR